MKKSRIAVLISGSGTNLQAIMDACKEGKIDGEIVCVGSDNVEAFGLERAEKARIPTFLLNYAQAANLEKKNELIVPADFHQLSKETNRNSAISFQEACRISRRARTRAVVEWELIDRLACFKADFLVCAGYMKVLTSYFHNKFQPDPFHPRVMNIHPALLPSFPGMHGYEDAWNYGCKTYGPTVHFMNHGIDTGPIIGQTALGRLEKDTIETFKSRGLQAEYELYPSCIQLFIQNRLKVKLGPDGKRMVVEILPRKKFSVT